MLELMITSFPFVLRVLWLRRKGLPITLYNVHRAVFAWLVLALIVFFAVFYYYPKSYTGIVAFRTVPVVPERAGTVTEVAVSEGEIVEPGQLLFKVEDTSERAAVAVAERRLAEVERAFDAAEAQVHTAQAEISRAEAALKQTVDSLADQENLRERGSSAFRENEYTRLVNMQAEREAGVQRARAELEAAQVQVDRVLPAQRDSAEATLEQARVELRKTEVHAQIAGEITQLTLFEGARAGILATRPVMLILPAHAPEERPRRVVAGFDQVARSVLRVGMPAEVACDSNFNIAMVDAVLPARVVRIQDAIAAGQIAPTGRLLEPSEISKRGEIVVYLETVYPEHEAMLVDGAGCIVQAYSSHETGVLGEGIVWHAVEALGALKAVLLRIKVWIALASGIGLSGSGGH